MFGKNSVGYEESPVCIDNARAWESEMTGYSGNMASKAISILNAAITASATHEKLSGAFVCGKTTKSYAAVRIHDISESTMNTVAYEYKRRGYYVVYFPIEDRVYSVFISWDTQKLLTLEEPAPHSMHVGLRGNPVSTNTLNVEKWAPDTCCKGAEAGAESAEEEALPAPDITDAQRQHEELHRKLYECNGPITVHTESDMVTIAPDYCIKVADISVVLAEPKGWTAINICRYLVTYAALVSATRELLGCTDKHNWCNIPVGKWQPSSYTSARKKLCAFAGVTLDRPMGDYVCFRYNGGISEIYDVIQGPSTYPDVVQEVSRVESAGEILQV